MALREKMQASMDVPIEVREEMLDLGETLIHKVQLIVEERLPPDLKLLELNGIRRYVKEVRERIVLLKSLYPGAKNLPFGSDMFEASLLWMEIHV